MNLEEQLRRALTQAWEESDTITEVMDAIEAILVEFRAKADMAAQPIEQREFGGDYHNVYNNPEKCGLVLLGSAEEGAGYDFHIVLLLQDIDSKRFFMVADSGCSCPTPFEDIRSVSDLTEVTDIAQAIQFLNAAESDRGWTDEGASLRKAIRASLPQW